VLTWWLGTRDERGRAVWLATSVVLAAVVSVAVYYGHFADVFRTLERVRARATVGDVATPGQDAAAAVERTGDRGASAVKGTMASELPGRVLLAVSLSQRAVGWPVFVLSVVGMWRLWATATTGRHAARVGATWVVFVAAVMMAPDARFSTPSVLDRVNYLSPAARWPAAWAWAWSGLTACGGVSAARRGAFVAGSAVPGPRAGHIFFITLHAVSPLLRVTAARAVPPRSANRRVFARSSASSRVSSSNVVEANASSVSRRTCTEACPSPRSSTARAIAGRAAASVAPACALTSSS
jgi:hypothetical protein